MSVHDLAAHQAHHHRNEPDATLSWGLYAAVLRRRWVTLLVCTLLGLASGYGYLQARAGTATAEAMVNLNVISQRPFDAPREPSGLIDAQTEVQTARSSRVLASAAGRLGGRTVDEMRAALTAEVLPDATVLRIAYTDTSIARATAGADEIARQFLDYRGRLAAERVGRVVDRLTARRDQLRTSLLAAEQTLATAKPRSTEAMQAAQDRTLLLQEFNDLVARLGELNSIDTTGGTVLTSAKDIGAAAGLRDPVVLAGGALLGLLLGCVLAFVRDRLDRRVRDARDVADAMAGPVLAGFARELGLPGSDRRDQLRWVWELAVGATSGRPPVLGLVEVGGHAGPDDAFGALAGGMAASLGDSQPLPHLVLVGFSRAQLHRLTAPIVPQQVSVSPGGLVLRGKNGGPAVRWIDPHADPADALDAVDQELRERRRAGTPTVVAVAAAAAPAARMVVARRADVTCFAVHRRHTLKRDLRKAVGEVSAVGGAFLGTVELRGRRGGRSVDEPPAGAAHPTDHVGTTSPVAAGQAGSEPGDPETHVSPMEGVRR